MAKFCIECNETIYGRSDKKFCDAACRNLHHNKLMTPKDKGVQHIQMVLKNNRKILAYLYQKQSHCDMTKQTLEAMGYNFAFHTHEWDNGKEVCVFCLDYGFVMDNQVLTILPFNLP
jgi:hypothetical protein